MSTPLFSIITATYNSAATIRKTIESVLDQSFDDYEYIIIDGLSKDDTLSIVSEYNTNNKIRVVSEKDSGIYDAWNKGIKIANGRWIAFLGSDDYLEPDALENYLTGIRSSGDVDYISSKVRLTDHNGRERVIGAPWSWDKFRKYMCVAHVGSIHSRKLYTDYGVYDTSYKITGDYEFLLRPGKNLKTGFINKVTATMTVGGVSRSLATFEETERAKVSTAGRNKFLAKVETLVAIFKYKYREISKRL